MDPEISALLEEEMRLRARIAELRRALPPEPVADLPLIAADGRATTLSALFDGRDDMLVIHNMGRGCTYCTLWADGLNGVLPHLESRTAVVLVSPDDPATQAEFAAGRGWRFRMASDGDGSFNRALAFRTDDGVLPGASALRRTDDGGIVRAALDHFGPGDPYCAVWHLFDLLDGGARGWEPRFDYGVAG